jgi:hypothetical protein
VTGFLAGPFEDSLDAALERAWARRGELLEMGQLASGRIRELVPRNPAAEFANTLLKITDRLAQEKHELKARRSSDRTRASSVEP